MTAPCIHQFFRNLTEFYKKFMETFWYFLWISSENQDRKIRYLNVFTCRNSVNSRMLLRSVSKSRKMKTTKFSVSPYGNTLLKSLCRWALLSFPVGHSSKKSKCHWVISSTLKPVLANSNFISSSVKVPITTSGSFSFFFFFFFFFSKQMKYKFITIKIWRQIRNIGILNEKSGPTLEQFLIKNILNFSLMSKHQLWDCSFES